MLSAIKAKRGYKLFAHIFFYYYCSFFSEESCRSYNLVDCCVTHIPHTYRKQGKSYRYCNKENLKLALKIRSNAKKS